MAAQPQYILTLEQQAAEADIDAGRNVLITGPAGSGKTVLLRRLKGKLGAKLAVTASTGIAAMNVGGVTLHSFASLGRGDGCESPVQIAKRILASTRSKVATGIAECRALAIDEISMISAEMLDKIDWVFRLVRGHFSPGQRNLPFGGVQLLCFGDFLQLPPVSTPESPASFAFEGEAWVNAGFRVHVLTRVFRQANQRLADALGCLRVGDIHNPAVSIIAGRNNLPIPESGPRPTVIHTRNVDVDRINAEELEKIRGRIFRYTAEDSGSAAFQDRLNRDCLCPQALDLKEGANVMLLSNLDVEEGLANGSMGTIMDLNLNEIVVRFGTKNVVSVPRRVFELKQNGEVVASRRQFPLRLAYALTAHKAQGLTLDRISCHLHPSNVFEAGMAYVAVSRVKTLDGLFLTRSSRTAFRAHPKALAFYEANTPQTYKHGLLAA